MSEPTERPEPRPGLGTAAIKGIGGIVAAVLTAVLVAVLVPYFTSDKSRSDESMAQPSSQPSVQTSSTGEPPRTDAKLYANRDSGPVGTRVRLSGSGFEAEEDVTLRFHVDVVGHTQTDADGKFADVSVKVPSDWRFTGQFLFIATGESSVKSASREFRVT